MGDCLVEAFVLIRTGTSESLNLSKIAKEKLAKVNGVKEVHEIFGHYDFIVRVETKTLGELSALVTDRIRGIKEVVSTETLIKHPD